MTSKIELQRITEGNKFRGFSTLFNKEISAWWATRRWWLNAIIWPVIICGLLANMLFIPTIANMASDAEISGAGSVTAYVIGLGLNVLFEFGTMVVAIGAVVLSLDAVFNELDKGICAWLLAKPVTRRSYILAKLAAYFISILVLLIGLPTLIGYAMLSIRSGSLFPMAPFLSGIGIMVLHTTFYLTLTVMLSLFFTSRIPLLAVTLGSALGGSLLGGLMQPLLHITPWMLPKIAALAASGQNTAISDWASTIIFSSIWVAIFIVAGLWKFEKMDL
jgi:ABC-type transport system involved in multi-copper enzyme maturation permease subunit